MNKEVCPECHADDMLSYSVDSDDLIDCFACNKTFKISDLLILKLEGNKQHDG